MKRGVSKRSFRFLTTGCLLLVLLLAGCALPGTDTGTTTLQTDLDRAGAGSTPFTVIAMSCGQAHTLAIKSDRTLWVAGRGGSGQLGLGECVVAPTFVQVPGMSDVWKVAAGGNHSLVLKTDGTLWAAGNNQYGQLGLGADHAQKRTFVKVRGDVISIASGMYHSLIVGMIDRRLWAAGNNHDGELGTGDTINRDSFAQVNSPDRVSAIAAGANHSLALREDTTLWTAGDNDYGQLGAGDTNERSTFTKVLTGANFIAAGGGFSLVLKSGGTIWVAGNNRSGEIGLGTTTIVSTFTQVPNMNNATAVAAGIYHSLVLRNDNTLWVSGANDYGQLGTGDTDYRRAFTQAQEGVSAIAGGLGYHSFALKDKIPAVTGLNNEGQLGNCDGSLYIKRFERKIALRSAVAPNNYVCADLFDNHQNDPNPWAYYNSNAPLYSNRNGIGKWETFGLIDLVGGRAALRAYSTGLYVCAENNGASRAVANRNAIGPWETFYKTEGSGIIRFYYEPTRKYLRFDSFIPEQSNSGPGVKFNLINAW